MTNELERLVEESNWLKNETPVTITRKDIQQISLLGYNTEEFLSFMVNKYEVLLHGSVQDKLECGKYILPGRHGPVYATNTASIALLKSIIYGGMLDNIGYPLDLSKDPLVVNLEGHKVPDTIREKGFVYIISDTKKFTKPKGNHENYTWERVLYDDCAKVSAIVEIEKEDFKYPIKNTKTIKIENWILNEPGRI